MTRLSLYDVWTETRAFLHREGALVFPLGFATLGIAMLVTGLIVPEPVAGNVPSGPWMLGMLPVFVLFLLGNLGISALALVPGITVRDAIRAAFLRLGTAFLLILLLMAIAIALIVGLSVVSVMIGMALGWTPAQFTSLALLLAMAPIVWAWIRLLTIWPHVVSSRDGARAALRASFRETKGRFWRLTSAVLLYFLLYVLFSSAVQFALGSLFLLLGRILGDPELGRLLTAICVALVGAVLGTGWTVFVARLHRRLAEG